MDRTVMLLLQALCAVALLSGSEANIRCYTCSSDADQRCADPMDKTLLPRECSLDMVNKMGNTLQNLLSHSSGLGTDAFGEQYAKHGGGNSIMACQKLDVYVSSPTTGIRTNTTIRGCALMPENPDEHCRRVSRNMQSALVQTTFCGACLADGCNGASGVSVTLLALVPAALTLLIAGRH